MPTTTKQLRVRVKQFGNYDIKLNKDNRYTLLKEDQETDVVFDTMNYRTALIMAVTHLQKELMKL